MNSADAAKPEGTEDQPRLGICCSGGGIRSSAFTLGALSALQNKEIRKSDQSQGNWLDDADYLATVSGGGFGALAWRLGKHTHLKYSRRLALEVPNEFSEAPAPQFDEEFADVRFFNYFWGRRRYLRTGRGGLVGSTIWVILLTLWNIVFFMVPVFLLAWLIGTWIRLATSWNILTTNGSESTTLDVTREARVDYVFWDSKDAHSWNDVPILGVSIPVYTLVLLFLISAVLYLVCRRLVSWNNYSRAARDKRIVWLAAIIALAIGPFLAVDVVAPLLSWVAVASVVAYATTGVLAPLVTFTVSSFAYRAVKFGGVLLAVTVVAGGLVWTAITVRGDEWPAGDWWLYPAALLIWGVLYFALDPTGWSLHMLYRSRLRAAFLSTKTNHHSHSTLKWKMGILPLNTKNEPLLSEYDYRPRPLICCSAARRTKDVTGVKAVSMVFEPSGVTLYDDPENPASLTFEEYEGVLERADRYRRFPLKKRLFEHRGWPSRKAHARISGLMALSGAALSPSMGRLDLGTSNSLFAAFNVRLGAWLPNPRHIKDKSGDENATVLKVVIADLAKATKAAAVNLGNVLRLVRSAEGETYKPLRGLYMFKELFGSYDLKKDPYVYVTDGGHWENLGLVELLRKRCKLIVCIDASGDPPGDFKTLRTAIELANLELGAQVLIEDEQFEKMTPKPHQRPDSAHLFGTIRYRNASGEGTLIYVKNLVTESSDRSIRGFAAKDPNFPDYSTVNQDLDAEQFYNLALLGRESTQLALKSASII